MQSDIASSAHRGRWGRRMLLAVSIVAVIVAFASPPRATPVAAAEPWTANADGVAVHDHWMADAAAGIGRLRLGQVILPASHDSATYGMLRKHAGPNPAYYATNQDIDIYTQLQHGIRVFDLRGKKDQWDNTNDYYVYHGKDVSDLALSTVLDDVQRWVAGPGHEKEIIILQIDAHRLDLPMRFDEICGGFKKNTGGLFLKPATFATAAALATQANATNPGAAPVPVPSFPNLGETDLAQYTVNEVWSLPAKQRVIVHWDDCVDKWQDDNTWNGYWANQCYSGNYSIFFRNAKRFPRPGILDALSVALRSRSTAANLDGGGGGVGIIPMKATTFNKPDAYGRILPHGFYTLGVHASITRDCGFPVEWLLPQQATVLDAVKTWFGTNEYKARDYLNIISADFVQRSKLVEYVIAMNKPLD